MLTADATKLTPKLLTILPVPAKDVSRDPSGFRRIMWATPSVVPTSTILPSDWTAMALPMEPVPPGLTVTLPVPLKEGSSVPLSVAAPPRLAVTTVLSVRVAVPVMVAVEGPSA